MRKVALDLRVRKTTLCEVRDGAVVQRATATSIGTLAALLGPDNPFGFYGSFRGDAMDGPRWRPLLAF